MKRLSDSKESGNMAKILIIDCMAICHYSKYASGLKNTSGDPTGLLFSFIGILANLNNRFKCEKIVFAWDSSESVRKKSYPPYKDTRKKKNRTEAELIEDQLFYDQTIRIRDEQLTEFGFKNVFHETGFEADDIIAHITKTHKDDIHFIVTRDNDMLQLLAPHVRMVDYTNMKVTTAILFERKYGISPPRWAKVKAIAGCTSDHVQGIKGVGEKTALKYLKGELKPHIKAYQRITSPEGRQIIKRNVPLVRLPHPEFNAQYKIQKSHPNLLKYFKKYEFNSYIKNFHRFKSLM